jgi:hypothetical protein
MNHEAVCALIGQYQLESRVFYISSNSGKSSSVFELGADVVHPDLSMISTRTLPTESIFSLFSKRDLSDYNYWVFDIQGAEMLALKGGRDALEYAKALYLEVNTAEVYKGCALLGEIDAFLAERGFKRVITNITNAHWGDALYVRAQA